MRKNNLFLLLIAMLFSVGLQARNIVVNTSSDIINAFNGAQDMDTISIAPGTYNTGHSMKIPPTGEIVLQSEYPDSVATLYMEINTSGTVADSVYQKKPSLIIQNLHLKGRHESFTAGDYLLSFNTTYFSMDTLAIRNCEISELGRCVFRSAAPSDQESAGMMNWFEMSNCIVHHENSAGNIWPMVYMAHVPTTVTFKDNTFYDNPYVKSIFQMNHMTNQSGVNATVNFINNTVCMTYARHDGIITTSDYLGQAAMFNINNNMFLLPTWSNDYNLSPSDTVNYQIPPIIRCTGGVITAHNNLIGAGMLPWLAGQTLDADGQGGFAYIDSTGTKSMSDWNFTWDDFANPSGGDFSYLSTKDPGTGGVGGAPIGDPRWVKTFTTPRTLNATANIDGATVTPARQFYEDGSSATVTASAVDGYKFVGWKDANGTLLSTDNPYTFTITSDMNIVANYNKLTARNVSITLSGSSTASYSISPDKTTYYDEDTIVVTLSTHYINKFLGWADGNMDSVRTVIINGSDVNLTANFEEFPYHLAWDFHDINQNGSFPSGMPADYATDPNNPGLLNCKDLGSDIGISTRNNKFESRVLYCAMRKMDNADASHLADPTYLYIKFSTTGLSNLKVKSMIGAQNTMFQVQKMQYSLDGTTYTDMANDTINGDGDGWHDTWTPFDGVLPSAADNQPTVYVRWIADTSSKLLELDPTSTVGYFVVSNIIVMDNTLTGLNPVTSNDMYKIYSVANKLYVNAQATGRVEVYSLVGQKVKDVKVNAGLNEIAGLQSGVYIVRVGSEIQKVIVK